MDSHTIKISSEQLKAMGASKPSEFDAKLSELITAANAPKDVQNVMSIEDVKTIFASTHATFDGKVSELQKKIDAVNPDQIKAAAETAGAAAGSRKAAECLGSVGASGAGVVKSEPNDSVQTDGAKALIDAGKFEEAWNASAPDSEAKREFVSAKSYAAYMRNSDSVRIVNR